VKNSRVTIHVIVGFLLTGFIFGHTTVSAAPPLKENSLTGVTQNWDKNPPSASRFSVLTDFGGAAVRDNTTGLVWEQTPSSGANTRMWQQAISDCVNKTTGGTVGWRLPSVVELKSIQDPLLPAPFVPPTVFTGVLPSPYWSASTNADFPSLAWYVDFGSGNVTYQSKANGPHVWCVRGAMNADTY
jgi:hypothetical protein